MSLESFDFDVECCSEVFLVVVIVGEFGFKSCHHPTPEVDEGILYIFVHG